MGFLMRLFVGSKFKLFMYGAVALAAVAAVTAIYRAGYNSAVSDFESAQAKAYKETIERLQDETIDTSDPDAVARELCRHAGIADCPLRRDGSD